MRVIMWRSIGSGLAVLALAVAAGCGDDDAETPHVGAGVDSGSGGLDASDHEKRDGSLADAGDRDGAIGDRDAAPPPPQEVDCADLPAGPFEPEVVIDDLDPSEDVAFDSDGTIAARQGSKLVRVAWDGSSTGSVTDWLDDLPLSAGMRFLGDGSLAVALFLERTLVVVSPEGEVSELLDGLNGANGVWVDPDDRIFVTASLDEKLSVVDADGRAEDLVTGLDYPNGVVFDSQRDALFFNDAGGKVSRIDYVGGEPSAPVEVAVLPDVGLDGMTIDECGNLYLIDFQARELLRQALDVAGDAIGDAQSLARFDRSVANPVFSRGDAFPARSLYVIGMGGALYRVPVEVGGRE